MEWQPIETAPEDGTWLLGFCSEWVTLIRRAPPNEHWRGMDTVGIRYVVPTHWMPIPAPPTAEIECPACGGTGHDTDSIRPDGLFGDCLECAASGNVSPKATP